VRTFAHILDSRNLGALISRKQPLEIKTVLPWEASTAVPSHHQSHIKEAIMAIAHYSTRKHDLCNLYFLRGGEQ
jgi:Na+-transporting methylmalonyl-CoA/oxaloacetate decarboxylase gamma subunit